MKRLPNKLQAEAIIQIVTIKSVNSGQPLEIKDRSDFMDLGRKASAKIIPEIPISIKTRARTISRASGFSLGQNLLMIMILQA